MISLENISSRIGDEIFFTRLNNSFEIGRIHGIWNETDRFNRYFLQILTGHIPLSSGIIRYEGEKLDHANVVYYNRSDMAGLDFTNGPSQYRSNNKFIYLFDNIFSSLDIASVVLLYRTILPLKAMGSTILITSTDYKALRASTDFFHIFSQGAFQAKLHVKQYELLDRVFMHLQR